METERMGTRRKTHRAKEAGYVGAPSLKADFIADCMQLGMELTGAVIKTAIATFALHQIGHLPPSESLATGTLLGATDFFARRGRSRFVHDLKERYVVRMPDGKVLERDTTEHEEER